MAVNWTAEQEQAIAARGSNILVAAAAGSGKTAVLVERIIRRICDAENPVSVDRLLVLTFTEAAAAEMKRKIAQAIYDRLQQEPDNPWLRQQNVLVHSAHISTVHAFCKTMIQNNIHMTDLPTDFTLIDQTENKILQSRALDEVLERYYKRIEKKHAFRDLAVGYGGIKSDDNLRNTVLSLYNFVQSMAYPERWLRESVKPYKQVCETGSIAGTLWEDRIAANCQELAQEVLCYYDCLAQIMKDEVPPDAAAYTYFTELPLRFREAFAPMLEGAASTAKCKEILATFKKGNARGLKDLDELLQGRVKYIRERLINPAMAEMKELLDATEPEQIQRMMQCAPRVKVLKQLVRQTGRLHKFMKRERSALDFNDLEHEFLALLTDKKGNPTTVARKLRMRFEEILVDEYQDTNDVQDTIFRMISREEKNIFMVGDLKQCIYQFRNAKPDIFAEKYRTYGKTDNNQCIQLQRNFRSRREVLDFANGVFASLMSRQLGGLDYTSEEYLIPGADYPEGAGNIAAEILVTDANKDNYTPDSPWNELENQELEAITVAERIQNLVAGRELLVTDKETGALRPVRLGDITILMQTST
ncbi:MAG: UvrD-helicase domain-containing protein, partial [Clostridia bacterium]|nr:UvrD-helicase domain-containing protein [Clostridia bacterium]